MRGVVEDLSESRSHELLLERPGGMTRAALLTEQRLARIGFAGTERDRRAAAAARRLRAAALRREPLREILLALEDGLREHAAVRDAAELGADDTVRAGFGGRYANRRDQPGDHVRLHAQLGHPETVDHVARRDVDGRRRVQRQVQLVGDRIRQLRIAELESELVADGLDGQHVALRVLQIGPDLGRVDREDDHQDRRDRGPPELEHRRVVDLDADRVGRRVLRPGEHDAEVDRVDRHDVEDHGRHRAQEAEQLVDGRGRIARLHEPDRHRARVHEVDHDGGDHRDQGGHGPEPGPEVRLRSDDSLCQLILSQRPRVPACAAVSNRGFRHGRRLPTMKLL